MYFHWKTILLPARIAEYVVVHEMAHLQGPHHTPEFWRRVERALPDFELGKDWLSRDGGTVEGLRSAGGPASFIGEVASERDTFLFVGIFVGIFYDAVQELAILRATEQQFDSGPGHQSNVVFINEINRLDL
jgi:hypothetical protein